MKKSFAFGMAVMALLAIGSVASAAPMPAGTLMHYWDCEDAGTGTLADTATLYVQDAEATAAPLTTPASVVTTTGVVGSGALVPTYSNATSSIFDLGGTFTMETWFRTDTYGCNGNNILMNGWSGVVGVHLNSGTLLATIVGGVTQVSGVWPDPGNPGTAAWTYLAVVADATAGTVTTYISRPADAGVLVQATQSTTYNGSSLHTSPFMLGATSDRAKYAGTNAFDDVAIWNTALGVDMLQSHVTNGLQLTLKGSEPSFHPGDANGDGGVDLQDFGLLKENFGIEIGGGALWAQGDFNNDGGIDLQDFGILKDHFGHTTGDVPVTAVPEPATMTLLALAGLGLIRRRK